MDNEASKNFSYDGVLAARFRCTRCDGMTSLWFIGLRKEARAIEAIYVHPPMKIAKSKTFDDFENGVVPERILRVYRDAVRSYDAGIWDGVATLCGKALEGIAKTELTTAMTEKGEKPKDVKNLGQQLNLMKDKIDFSGPFDSLGEAIREGRNLGAHFDATVETDEEMAAALLDLVEYALEFVYVFKHKAGTVKQRILELSSKQLSEPEANTEPDPLEPPQPAPA